MGPVNQIRLSAVVPCYREAQSIPVMHERLTKVFTEMGVDWEIIRRRASWRILPLATVAPR
jgi:hypothetical protein